jgi:hypothetical protein
MWCKPNTFHVIRAGANGNKNDVKCRQCHR